MAQLRSRCCAAPVKPGVVPDGEHPLVGEARARQGHGPLVCADCGELCETVEVNLAEVPPCETCDQATCWCAQAGLLDE